MWKRNVATSIHGAVLAVLLVACGGNPTGGQHGASPAGQQHAREVYDKLATLSGQERTAELKRLSGEEKELSVYTSNTDIDDIVKGYESAYGIKVNVYRANSESVLQRILQERSANFAGADLVETNAGEMNVLNKEGALYPYRGGLRDQVRKEGQAEGWTATRFNVFVVGWNTTLVKPGEEPRTIEELADPRWKGRISLEIGDVDWFSALYRYYKDAGRSDEQILALFGRIAANAKVTKGHTVQGELLSAGQFGASVSAYSHTIDKAAAKGAPVSWKPSSGQPVQPIVIRPDGAGLMTTAKSPAAAVLFMDWELTGGQRLLAQSFRVSALAGGDDPLAGLKVVTVPEQELLDDPRKWDDLYARVLQGREQVGGR
jgi:iron(III) transport system substrate-binding protein